MKRTFVLLVAVLLTVLNTFAAQEYYFTITDGTKTGIVSRLSVSGTGVASLTLTNAGGYRWGILDIAGGGGSTSTNGLATIVYVDGATNALWQSALTLTNGVALLTGATFSGSVAAPSFEATPGQPGTPQYLSRANTNQTQAVLMAQNNSGSETFFLIGPAGGVNIGGTNYPGHGNLQWSGGATGDGSGISNVTAASLTGVVTATNPATSWVLTLDTGSIVQYTNTAANITFYRPDGGDWTLGWEYSGQDAVNAAYASNSTPLPVAVNYNDGGLTWPAGWYGGVVQLGFGNITSNQFLARVGDQIVGTNITTGGGGSTITNDFLRLMARSALIRQGTASRSMFGERIIMQSATDEFAWPQIPASRTVTTNSAVVAIWAISPTGNQTSTWELAFAPSIGSTNIPIYTQVTNLTVIGGGSATYVPVNIFTNWPANLLGNIRIKYVSGGTNEAVALAIDRSATP